MARFPVRCVERRWETVLGGGMVARTRRWWWWEGGALRNARRGGGLGRNQKPSCCSSVSGAPCGMAMGDGASGWHGGTYEAVVVVGSCGREARGGEGVWVKIPKSSCRGSISGCNGAAGGGEGYCSVTAPPPMLTESVGMVVSEVVMEVVVVVLTWHHSTYPLLPTHSHPFSTHS